MKVLLCTHSRTRFSRKTIQRNGTIGSASRAPLAFEGLPLEHGNIEEATEGGMELYDLKKDPHEMANVYGNPAYREAENQLKKQLARKKENLGDI